MFILSKTRLGANLTSMPAPKLGILFLIPLAAGCVWNGPVRSLATAANQRAVVERDPDGTAMMRSQQTHLVSVISRGTRFSHDSYALPSLYVIVTNGGDKDLTLKPGDISAYSGDQRVALLNPSALQERLDRADVSGPVSFPVGMRDASQPAEIRRGHHRSLTDPPIQPFAELKFKVPAQFVEQALQPQVLRPGDSGDGRIMLESQDILSGLPLKIVVNVAGEKHEFLFEVQY
jgi:hypothetical protein